MKKSQSIEDKNCSQRILTSPTKFLFKPLNKLIPHFYHWNYSLIFPIPLSQPICKLHLQSQFLHLPCWSDVQFQMYSQVPYLCGQLHFWHFPLIMSGAGNMFNETLVLQRYSCCMLIQWPMMWQYFFLQKRSIKGFTGFIYVIVYCPIWIHSHPRDQPWPKYTGERKDSSQSASICYSREVVPFWNLVRKRGKLQKDLGYESWHFLQFIKAKLVLVWPLQRLFAVREAFWVVNEQSDTLQFNAAYGQGPFVRVPRKTTSNLLSLKRLSRIIDMDIFRDGWKVYLCFCSESTGTLQYYLETSI